MYEDTNLDQSPLAWLQQELFAPAIPAFKGYQSRAGFIGLSATGGSVLCPNKTCAESGARLCDGLGGKCAGFSFFQPADCKPVCAVQWHGGNITQEASFCDPATCKETGGARWNLCECGSPGSSGLFSLTAKHRMGRPEAGFVKIFIRPKSSFLSQPVMRYPRMTR